MIGTAKHFIGDGGTEGGKDQGVNPSSELEMINIHGQGYYGALAAGSQSVMISFNSWTNEELGINEGKLHGSRKAITEILKGKMGFDGLVVSDWNGIGQVPGCTNASCPQAINAGMDVVMVPHDWKAFIANTIAQVKSGEIPMARIDDAVTRILRVKLRPGLMDQPKPSKRRYARDDDALQDPKLARARGAQVARAAQEPEGPAAAVEPLEGARGRQERRLAAEPDRRLEPLLAGDRQHQRRLPERHVDPRRAPRVARRVRRDVLARRARASTRASTTR